MRRIRKIILHNFKRFVHLELDVMPDMNILIGDNESGKSSILQAIDLVSHGSRHRVETIGVEHLFNVNAISQFMIDRDMTKIPEMYVELFFNDNEQEPRLNGNNNSKHINAFGIRMLCKYDSRYSRQISEIFRNPNAVFPLEFFCITFETFSGESYNGYTKWLKDIFIDNSQIGSPYAMREYVHNIYISKVSDNERVSNRHAYHTAKKDFQSKVLEKYSMELAPYRFSIKDTFDDNIETGINLEENNVPIENKGTGKQCFIKTELALNNAINEIDSVLIEEPETHLSYMNMLKLIEIIKGTQNRQLFISTHSDLISTRLNLKKCILMNSLSDNPISLSGLTTETAKFFMKAPDNNMLQFVLSNKVILVEGDAEFILMEAMFKKTTGKEFADSGIGVIAVDGKCFKRYLEIAKLVNIKVVVITDNDYDYNSNIVENYRDYIAENIMVFSDDNDTKNTFEVCVYNDNKEMLNKEFHNLIKNTPLGYMLANKTEAAFRILEAHANDLVVPLYIQKAIKWIED